MECRRGLAIRILSVRPSICLSVCLSVKRVNCDKTEARSVQIFIPYERSFSDLSAIAERLVHIGWSTQWRGEKFSTGGASICSILSYLSLLSCPTKVPGLPTIKNHDA